VKTVAVFAIIFGCFAVLYPKIFHPMFLHLLGMSPARRSADDMSKNIMMINHRGGAPLQRSARVRVRVIQSNPIQ